MPSSSAIAFGAGAATASVLTVCYSWWRRRQQRFRWCSQHLTSSGTVVLRSALPSEISIVYNQIYSVAAIHHAEDDLRTTAADIAEAFGRGAFHVLLVEVEETTVGHVIFQDSYRTWSGPSLYVQDIFIQQAYRGRGLGTLVWRVLAAIAKSRRCDRMSWESYAGNDKANAFYSRCLNASHVTGQEQLFTWKLIDQQLDNLAADLGS
jgi:diamine N-acetyltransferase